MPGRAKSVHTPKLSTKTAGDFCDGITVSRKGTRRVTTAILPPKKGGR